MQGTRMGGSHQHLIISSINRSIPVNEYQLLTAEAHGGCDSLT